MIQPGNYDITIQQNATFSQQFQFFSGSGTTTPLNMTGYSVAATMWAEGKTSTLATFTQSWVSQSTGIFTLSLTSATTASLTQSGIWDCLVTNPDGTKDFWLRGNAILTTGYTS